jgi:DNA-binding transcriptional LysR family regulator
LEQRVGVRLINRTTRSLNLTDEGRTFYANINPLVAGIEDAVTVAAGSSQKVKGRLRVNVDPFTSRLLLSPYLFSFLQQYPEISLDLIARDQLGDLVADGFDLAVRFGEPPISSLVAKPLMVSRLVTVAAPAYLRAHGRPLKLSDLRDHACIQVRNPMTGQPYRWEFARGRKRSEVEVSGRLLVTDVGTILNACLSGVGIAQIKEIGIRQQLARGELVELFPEWGDERMPLYALYPSRHLPAAKVRAFIDFVQRILTTQVTTPRSKRQAEMLDAP